MDEAMLLKICVLTALIGLILLFLISGREEISKGEIEREDKGLKSSVKLAGEVVNIRESGNTVIIQIKKEDKISIVAFKARNLSIPVGSVITVEGREEIYNGKLEIIADKIRVS